MCPRIVAVQAPDSRHQDLTVPSCDAENSAVPSSEHTSEVIVSLWPASRRETAGCWCQACGRPAAYPCSARPAPAAAMRPGCADVRLASARLAFSGPLLVSNCLSYLRAHAWEATRERRKMKESTITINILVRVLVAQVTSEQSR